MPTKGAQIRRPSKRSKDKDKDRERDRDRDSPRDKSKDDREPHRRRKSTRKVSSSSSTSWDRDRDLDRDRRRRTRSSSPTSTPTKTSSTVSEMERQTSTTSIRSSTKLPSYPSFSKAHSREAIGSRDNIATPRVSLYTPDPTDLGHDTNGSARSSPGRKSRSTTPMHARGTNAPPSPPLTATDSGQRRAASTNTLNTPDRQKTGSPPPGRRSADDGYRRTKSTKSASSLRRSEFSRDDASRRETSSAGRSSPSTLRRWGSKKKTASPKDAAYAGVTSTATESDGTSTLNGRPQGTVTTSHSSPTTASDASPKTPVQHHPPISPFGAEKQASTPPVNIFPDLGDATPVRSTTTATHDPTHGYPAHGISNAPPPPPPPPMMAPPEIPRVDYLLQNGGLSQLIPKRLLAAANPQSIPNYQTYQSPVQPAAHSSAEAIFSPLYKILSDYNQVMAKNGSLAVATGYRSVARRLLDRLEAVFARSISSEGCFCVMCRSSPDSPQRTAEDSGLSWGEILEYVSGRRELPLWPPFTISSTAEGLGISMQTCEAPMQKLDIDIPEEYRAHYVRQSKKTQQAVQAWLASQPSDPSSPPAEIDDETLTFAILTHLEPAHRPLFTALHLDLPTVPKAGSRPPSAIDRPRSELLVKTSLAIQRLYRLARPPRDAECTIYLLKNPQIHSVLATLAAVSEHEWDILVSGRFDGFLWSGAETVYPFPQSGRSTRSPSVSRQGHAPFGMASNSRVNTPFAPSSRGPTPFSPQPPLRSIHSVSPPPPSSTPFSVRPPSSAATTPSFGAPVSLDEDTEIAVLAEIEREIYTGMEALEDAFEALHAQAEAVRQKLRARGAGLAMLAQARRGGLGGVEVRGGTPASGWADGESEGERDCATEVSWFGERSEIRPDDSASNVSIGRRKRKEARSGRRGRIGLVMEAEP